MIEIKSWAFFTEESAQKQLENIVSLPFIHHHIAVMPDVHFGIGATVGSVIPTLKAIIPAAVGVDIGCGMVAQRTSIKATDLPDSLNEIRSYIESRIPVGFSCNSILKLRTSELSKRVANQHETLGRLNIPENLKTGRYTPEQQLGTLGGGNHFIELCLDELDYVWIMLHSGSRGVGNRIGRYFIEKAKKDMERFFINLPDRDLAYFPEGSQVFKDYILAVNYAQEYAKLNRDIMLDVVKTILHDKFNCTFTMSAINCHHNYVAIENHYGQNCYVTRKGAVRARKHDLGIIPGSMGTKSYIVEGKGNKESFNSCSHGAGRIMSRTQAKKQFSLEEHIEATRGVECRKDVGVLDETPGAYKDIDKVMDAQKDLVDIKHTLKQFLCIKG